MSASVSGRSAKPCDSNAAGSAKAGGACCNVTNAVRSIARRVRPHIGDAEIDGQKRLHVLMGQVAGAVRTDRIWRKDGTLGVPVGI